MGPWYILMDEFLASGETIVRNLQMGLGRGAAFGGVMELGYLPDMFGHIAQMPQILQLAGFHDAVVWRGVPSQVTKNAFIWESPDGSSVRAEYLPVGYGNGAALPDDAKALIRRTSDNVAEVADFLMGDLLCMNGSDHLMPQPWLGRVVAEANDLQDEFDFEVTSLPRYLADAPTRGTDPGGGRAPLRAPGPTCSWASPRTGSTSSAAARSPSGNWSAAPSRWPPCSRRRRTTPTACWSWPGSRWCATRRTTPSAPARSTTSSTPSCTATPRRAPSPPGWPTAPSRPSPARCPTPVPRCSTRRSGPAPASSSWSCPADGPAPADVQVLSERSGLPGSMVLDADTVRTVLAMMQGPRISDDAWIHDVLIEDTDEGFDITIAVGTEEKPGVPIAEAKQDVYTRLGARPDAVVRVAMEQPSTRKILARTAEVPGYGWAAFEPAPLAHPVEVSESRRLGHASRNGLVRVDVDPATGTFALDGTPGYGRLVDGGDLGDSYNYSPPRQDSFVDTPLAVTVRIDERGPVRARVRITSTYDWPDHVDGSSQARVGGHQVDVHTDVEVRADDATVRVVTAFVNPSGDHRLRVHLPLPEPAQHSEAESAFTVVTRGLTAEGRPDEFGLPTAPANRFVSAGRLTVVHEGVCEYELIDIEGDAAHTLALTVLRSTGMLSRLGMAYRPFPAGPLTPVEGLQMRGKQVELRYALALDCDDPYRLADDVLLPLEPVLSLGGGPRPDSGSEMAVHGAEVSALHRVAGVLEVRVFNPTASPAVVSFPGRTGWLVDLRGYPEASFEGSFELRPFGIATARLRGA